MFGTLADLLFLPSNGVLLSQSMDLDTVFKAIRKLEQEHRKVALLGMSRLILLVQHRGLPKVLDFLVAEGARLPSEDASEVYCAIIALQGQRMIERAALLHRCLIPVAQQLPAAHRAVLVHQLDSVANQLRPRRHVATVSAGAGAALPPAPLPNQEQGHEASV
ncbi:MAG: hypothetical protein ACRYGK_06845 [Janthinobacterium lividum]